MVRTAFDAFERVSSPARWILSLLKRHDDCLLSGLSSCDCGPLRDHILPPWAIYAVSKVRKTAETPIQMDVNIAVMQLSLSSTQEEDASLLNVTPDGHVLQVWCQHVIYDLQRFRITAFDSMFARTIPCRSHILLSDCSSCGHPPSACVCQPKKWRKAGRKVPGFDQLGLDGFWTRLQALSWGGLFLCRVLRKFQYLLNPRQVYNLSNGGPAPGY